MLIGVDQIKSAKELLRRPLAKGRSAYKQQGCQY